MEFGIERGSRIQIWDGTLNDLVRNSDGTRLEFGIKRGPWIQMEVI